MKEKVYLDSTIPSYYFDQRESLANFIEVTRKWWLEMSGIYDVFISDSVLQELNDGNYPQKGKIIEFVSTIPLLPIADDLEQIVEFYIDNHVMPKTLIGDAVHLAYTSYYDIEYLLTWNCNHLANANKRKHIRIINARLGLSTPEIITLLESLDVEIMQADFTDSDSISTAIKENSIVYNCIADPKLHQPIKKYREIEVELTRQIAEIASRQKVRRFVQLSTVVVYGFDRPPKPIDERFPCKPIYNFDRVMLEREQAVKDVAANTGLDVVVLRPAGTIGNRDRASFFAMFYEAHEKGQYPIIGNGRARFSCIDTRDIGRAMVWLGELEEAKGQTYLAKGYETSWLELKIVFDDNFGKTAKIQKLPKSIAMFVGTLMEWITPYSRQPLMTRFAVRSLTTDALFDDRKLRETGFRPKYSFEESVKNAIVDLQSRHLTNTSS